jgi:heparin binding hemagglutinin HbhA
MPTLTKNTVTPLYAIAGAGDLAVEKLREVSDDVTTRFAALKEQKTVQTELSKAQTELAKAQAELTKRFEALAADAKTVPAQLRELPGFVQAGFTTVLGQAEETYGELAGRGKDLVTRIRSQQATEDLEAQAKSTVTKAKATRTSTRKAADTATRSVKATATSARKTAKSAAKAAGDAADKVGD